MANGETFPNVTFPDFERHAGHVRRLADVVALLVFPLVSTDQREGWEAYSIQHQHWVGEGLALQEQQQREDDIDDGGQVGEVNHKDLEISPRIYRIKEGTTEVESERGPGPCTLNSFLGNDQSQFDLSSSPSGATPEHD